MKEKSVMRDTVLPFLVMVTVSPQIHYIDMPQGRATQRALGGCPSHSLSTKSPDRIPKALRFWAMRWPMMVRVIMGLLY